MRWVWAWVCTVASFEFGVFDILLHICMGGRSGVLYLPYSFFDLKVVHERERMGNWREGNN